MRTTISILALALTLAGCDEADREATYEGDGYSTAAITTTTTTTMVLVEVCNDGIDNDMDGLVDGSDPSCRYAKSTSVAGGGFIGNAVDGGDIFPRPWDLIGATHTVTVYDYGRGYVAFDDGRNEVYVSSSYGDVDSTMLVDLGGGVEGIVAIDSRGNAGLATLPFESEKYAIR